MKKKEKYRVNVRQDFKNLSDEDVQIVYNVLSIAGYALSTYHSCIDRLSGVARIVDKVDRMREELLLVQEVFYNEAVKMGKEMEKNQTQLVFDDFFKKIPFMKKEDVQKILEITANTRVPEIENIDI